MISETSGMMPNFAGFEKFFAHMTFKAFGASGRSCRKQFSTRRILNAKPPKPGGASRWKPRAYRGTTLTRRPATYNGNRPIVTEITKASVFYPAEEYHQDYLQKNPGGYNCHYLRN